MAPTDKLLSIDMGIHDCFYRFRRDSEPTSTVVYVHLQNLVVIAQDHQTYGPGLIDDLRNNVEVWDQQWTTLTVFREDGKIQYTRDQFKPHFLPSDAALSHFPRLNVLDLEMRHGFKNRVFLVQLDSRRQILKICPFRFELQYFTQEIKASLSDRGCTLIPRLSAYVFDRSEEQIIGFVCDELQGMFAVPEDYYGPRFIDLEKSILDTDGKISKDEFSHLQQQELDGLEKALHDEEGWGRPWPEIEP